MAVEARKGARRYICEEEENGAQPYSVVDQSLQPHLSTLMLCLLALVCLKTSQKHVAILLAEPLVLCWEVRNEDEDEYSENDCDQSLNHEDPLPAVKRSSEVHQSICE